MSEQHSAEYRRETAALPLGRQLEVLEIGWRHAVSGQQSMGFKDTVIIKGLAAFLISLFPARAQAADFFAALSMDLRASEATEQRAQQSGPATIN